MPLLGYFISFRTYGTWLHGHAEGSVDDEHATPGTPLLPPDPARQQREFAALKHSPVELDAEQRFVVHATIGEVCAHRAWRLAAINIRTTHVHTVVYASHTPERVMNDFKAYATRRLREAGVLPPDVQPWSYHGSTRYLNTENSVVQAVDYVLHRQGPALDMRCAAEWKEHLRKELRP